MDAYGRGGRGKMKLSSDFLKLQWNNATVKLATAPDPGPSHIVRLSGAGVYSLNTDGIHNLMFFVVSGKEIVLFSSGHSTQ